MRGTGCGLTMRILEISAAALSLLLSRWYLRTCPGLATCVVHALSDVPRQCFLISYVASRLPATGFCVILPIVFPGGG